MVPSRVARVFAVLVLLLHALMPGFHALQHALEHAGHAGHAANPEPTTGDARRSCACEHAAHDEASSNDDRGIATLAAVEDDHAHDCAVCVLLAASRDVLPTDDVGPMLGVEPLRRQPITIAAARAPPSPALRPPVRAPPHS